MSVLSYGGLSTGLTGTSQAKTIQASGACLRAALTGTETEFTREGTSRNMAGIRVGLASARRRNTRSVGSLVGSAVPAGCVFLLLLFGLDMSAQQPAPRITGEISNASRS